MYGLGNPLPPTHASMHTAYSHPMACFLQHPKILSYSYVFAYFVLVHMHTYILLPMHPYES